MQVLLTNFLKNPAATLKLMNDLLLKNSRQRVGPKLMVQGNIDAEASPQRGEQNDIRAVAVMLSAEARKSSVKSPKLLKHRKDRKNRQNEDEK